MMATFAPPALDIEALRKLVATVLAFVSAERLPGCRAVVDDALDRIELAAALDDPAAAREWVAFLRRRLDAWSGSESVKRGGVWRPCTARFLRQWQRAEAVAAAVRANNKRDEKARA